MPSTSARRRRRAVVKKAPRKPAPASSRPAPGRDARRAEWVQQIDSTATAVAFDAIDEKFIDFLVEEALKTWRARIS